MRSIALITGIAGFAGSHLTEFLLTKDIAVYGFFHQDHPTENIEHLKDKIHLTSCDILNSRRTESEITKIDPDYVFHLAAFSSPAQSFVSPRQTLENNIVGQLNVLEALAKIKSQAKILIVGSADEYGNIETKYLPADENTPFAPISPYAVSKVAQDMLGLQFFLQHNLNIVRVRPFNHIGPRQSTSFVTSSFASQIAKLEADGGGTIKAGNLEAYRDFTDVRDMVKAYLLALEKGTYGQVYNIGSGRPVKIAKILEILISLSNVKIKVKVDKNLFRPVDIRTIYCDSAEFRKQTGWRPTIPLIKTLSDTIEYERNRLKNSP